MKQRLLTLAVIILILLGAFAEWSSTRCGWMEERFDLPCLSAPIGKDRFCAIHDVEQRARIEGLLRELKEQAQ